MSLEAINRLLEDIEKDPSEWQRDRQVVIGRYGLSPEERDAVSSGDETKLRAMGVEERLVKGARWTG